MRTPLLGLSLVCVCAIGWSAETPTEIERRLLKDAAYLSSDELEGRGPRTKGLDLAADYLADEFSKAGLRVDTYGEDPFQIFHTYTDRTLKERTASFVNGDTRFALPNESYQPLSIGAAGKVDASLVFAGYGITAPDLNYDDYERIDANDKVAIILRHEPRQNDPESKFNGRSNSPHAFLARKVENAIAHGAVGVLFVSDAIAVEKAKSDTLLGFRIKKTPQAAVMVAHIKREEIDRLLKTNGQASLAELEAGIDEDLKPHSIELKQRLVANVEIETVRSHLKNVVATLPGSGDLAEETLVIGAHYDHLGRGGNGSLAPWTTSIHNGADDNASGTACILEIARQLSKSPAKHRRRIVFICFSAEEMGLVGSERYVRSPRFPLESTIAMLNFDMVGRLTKDRMQLHGIGTAAEFDAIASEAAKKQDITLIKRKSGYGPSDHTSFYKRNVPVLHFFTGLHRDYHRPSDDSDKLNVAGMKRITLMAVDVAANLATRTEPLEVRKADEASDLADLLGPLTRSGTGPVWLGVRVSPSEKPTGLKVTEVFEGSPAATGQIREGDVILKVAGDSVTNLAELKSKIEPKKSEDVLDVRLLRGAIEMELQVTLKAR